MIEYPPDRVLGYDELEELVEPRLPANAPFLLVGESFAGPLAARLAARPRENLRGLVLAASFVTRPGPAFARLLPWRRLFHLPLPDEVLRRFLAGDDDGLLREIRASIAPVTPEVLGARVAATLDADARAALARTTVPLLYLRARRDRVVAARCLRDVRALRPDVVVARLPTPHPVLQHDPAGAWEAIRRFVARLDG